MKNKKGKFPVGLVTLAAVVFALVIVWIARTPAGDVKEIPEKFILTENNAVLSVKTENDAVAENAQVAFSNIPGYDEVLIQNKQERAFVTGMDGCIWKLDLATGEAEVFVDPPVSPAGMQPMPNDPDTLLFCASKQYGFTYPGGEQVGVYKLNVATKEVTPVITRTPIIPKEHAVPDGNHGTVYPVGAQPISLAIADMNESNSVLCSLCNDLAISADGNRVYFTEPFTYPSSTMGGGTTVVECISLGENGLIWCIDLEKETISLVGQGYTFADGILLECPEGGDREESIIISELAKCRLSRLYIDGANAGKDEIVQENLPGMPDGLDRDESGNIWVALVEQRSNMITLAHKNPWIKPLALRLPYSIFESSNATGIVCLSPDGSTPLYCTMHDGSVVSDFSVIVPNGENIYFCVFNRGINGLHYMKNPLL